MILYSQQDKPLKEIFLWWLHVHSDLFTLWSLLSNMLWVTEWSMTMKKHLVYWPILSEGWVYDLYSIVTIPKIAYQTNHKNQRNTPWRYRGVRKSSESFRFCSRTLFSFRRILMNSTYNDCDYVPLISMMKERHPHLWVISASKSGRF